MINELNRICLLSLLITLLSLSTVYSSDGKWDIEIALDKQDYLLHEPVVLDVTVTNNTSDTLGTHGLIEPNNFQFHILLTDSDGKEVTYTGPRSNGVWGPGELLLDAAEQDYNCFNLLDLFASIEGNSGYSVPRMWFSFIPKGTYTVKVYYDGYLSKELTFNIVEPYGQEVEVLRRIEQARQVMSQSDTDPSSRAFGEIVRDHPNSAYAELCYFLSVAFSQENPTGLGNTRIRNSDMLSKYPNSAEVRGWLLSLTFRKSEDETIAIYDELIAENPNTRCSKIASMLKKRMLAKREAGE